MSFRDWMAQNEARAGIASGVAFGGSMALAAMVARVPAIAAAIAGALAGLAFGFLMTVSLRRASRDLSHLDPGQRLEVLRAVKEGRAPTTAALAGDVVQRARKLQAQNSNPRSFLVLVVFAALSVLVAIGRAAAGALRVVDVLQVLLWIALFPYGRYMSRRGAARARDAELAAASLSARRPDQPGPLL